MGHKSLRDHTERVIANTFNVWTENKSNDRLYNWWWR